MVSLLDLQTAFYQRSEQVNNQYIATAELTSYINASAQELYDLLIVRYEKYFVTGPVSFTITTPPDSGDAYTLPADFYKLIKIERQDTSSPEPWYRLKKANFQENNNTVYDGGGQLVPGYAGHWHIEYDIVGGELYLYPYQYAAGTYRIWYAPFMTLLVNPTDALPATMTGAGWHEYIICDCLVKWAMKQEDEFQGFLMQKEAVKQRIIDSSINRDEGQAMRVTEVIDSNGRRGGRGGWGGF